jgi:hypothetical protein
VCEHELSELADDPARHVPASTKELRCPQ